MKKEVEISSGESIIDFNNVVRLELVHEAGMAICPCQCTDAGVSAPEIELD